MIWTAYQKMNETRAWKFCFTFLFSEDNDFVGRQQSAHSHSSDTHHLLQTTWLLHQHHQYIRACENRLQTKLLQ